MTTKQTNTSSKRQVYVSYMAGTVSLRDNFTDAVLWTKPQAVPASGWAKAREAAVRKAERMGFEVV